jgi:hypothetical protein
MRCTDSIQKQLYFSEYEFNLFLAKITDRNHVKTVRKYGYFRLESVGHYI